MEKNTLCALECIASILLWNLIFVPSNYHLFLISDILCQWQGLFKLLYTIWATIVNVFLYSKAIFLKAINKI